NVSLVWDTLVFQGDGTNATQVFTVDGSTLNFAGNQAALKFANIPAGTPIVVNVTGAAANMKLNSLLSPSTGGAMDAGTREFGQIASNLVWNFKDASNVVVTGTAQVPGSILVPNAQSTTEISAAGTNGRILVAGDLEHTGSGGNEMHAYPLIGALECVVEGETPKVPVTPLVPSKPETPKLPDTPDVPAEPEVPLTPMVPAEPG